MNCANQPPCLNPCSPLGSSTTPSRDMFSLTTIFPISALLIVGVFSYHWCRHRDIGKLGAHQPPSSPHGRCLYRTRCGKKGRVAIVTTDLISKARTGDGDAF